MDALLIEELLKKAREAGMHIHAASLKRHPAQGYMNEVFTAQSSSGKVIIHSICPSPGQTHVFATEKIPLIPELLANTGVRVPQIYFSFARESRTLFVSEFLPGASAGEMKVVGDACVYDWYVPRTVVEDEVIAVLARIHSVRLPKFGWIGATGTGGGFPSWLAFLESEVAIWVEKIREVETGLGQKDLELAGRLRTYFESNRAALEYPEKPSLVHGDLTNPSNILVADGKVIGIIDWEFALAGDPAWEFAFQNEYPLADYFARMRTVEMPIREDSFESRVRAYWPLNAAFWTYLHANEPEGELYRLCRKLLAGAVA